jgi:uncharacterized protein YuzB (UPF0349 family)
MTEKITIRNCTFAYKCQAKWDNLEIIDYDDVRFCQDCQKEVHFCHTDEELVQNIHLNRCVAINRHTTIEMGYFAPEKIK